MELEDEFFSICMPRIIIGGLAVCVVGCIGGWLVFTYIVNMAFDNCTSGYSSFVREHGEFEIPQNAINVETCDNRFDSNSVSARFEIAPPDLEPFLLTTLIIQPLSTEGKPDITGIWLWDKWKSEIALIHEYLYGSYESDGLVFQRILIDISNPECFVVYMWEM